MELLAVDLFDTSPFARSDVSACGWYSQDSDFYELEVDVSLRYKF